MKTVVVLPAYNASATLRRTLDAIPYEVVDEVILVDDASADGTYELAHELAATHPKLTTNPTDTEKALFTVARFEHNRGYGGNQKYCYDLAFERGAEIVVMLHPDYQYDPACIPALCAHIQSGADVALGSRIRSWHEAQGGGMPLYKYVGNRVLTSFQNLCTGQRLSEWHTGMRAYRASALRASNYHSFSDDFVFDTQILLTCAEQGWVIAETPVPVRYFPEASMLGLSGSVQYGFATVMATTAYVGRRMRASGTMKSMIARPQRGFTLIELLLAISIIGLISSVILTSANASRAKAADARVKSDLRALVNQSAIHYTNPGKAFGTRTWTANASSFTPGSGTNGSGDFFDDRTVGLALSSAAQQAGAVSYGSNDSSWIVVSRLRTGGYWCIDSGGTAAGRWYYQAPAVSYNYGTPAYRCL